MSFGFVLAAKCSSFTHKIRAASRDPHRDLSDNMNSLPNHSIPGMVTKQERKKENAAAYAKWLAELTALPNVEDVGDSPMCTLCKKGGISKAAFPMWGADGKFNEPQQAYECHKACCWMQCNAQPTMSTKKMRQQK